MKKLTVGLVTMFALFVAWYERTPKGIRNNNPLNIRGNDSFKWEGEIDRDFDDFVIFETPEKGIRAAGRTLKTYRDKYQLNTVEGIINRWAPPSENDTDSYIKSVSNKIGVMPNQPLRVAAYADLVAAMIYHENGQNPYKKEVIRASVLEGLS